MGKGAPMGDELAPQASLTHRKGASVVADDAIQASFPSGKV